MLKLLPCFDVLSDVMAMVPCGAWWCTQFSKWFCGDPKVQETGKGNRPNFFRIFVELMFHLDSQFLVETFAADIFGFIFSKDAFGHYWRKAASSGAFMQVETLFI